MPTRKGNYMYLKVSGLSINGQALPDIEYERTEYSDGRIEEKGLPAGMKARPSINDLLTGAMTGVVPRVETSRIRFFRSNGRLAHAFIGVAGITGDRVKTLCGRELEILTNWTGEKRPEMCCWPCSQAARKLSEANR